MVRVVQGIIMKKLALLAAFLVTSVTSALAGPYDVLWSKFKIISVTPTTATTPVTAQNNFPLLVRLNSAGGVATGSDVLAGSLTAGGLDIRFADSAGNALSFEKERWSATNDSAEFWVLVPQLKGSGATTKIRIYYGKSGETNASNSQAVFDTANGFRAVWHMNATSNTADELDATANKLDATAWGSPGTALGGLGGSRSLTAAPNAFVIGKTQTNRGVYFTDANNGYAVGLSGLALKTTDGGVTWNTSKTGVLTTALSLNAVACPTADTCYAAGGSGISGSGTTRFMTRTTNTGASWAKQSATDSAASSLTYFGLSCLSSSTCLAVGGNYGTSRYYATLKASTGTWSLPTTTVTSHMNSVSCVAGGNCYAVGGNSSTTRVATRFVYTPASDSVWTVTTQDSVASSGLLNGVHCTTNDLCYAVGQNGVITKTTNASTTGTWTALTSGVTNNLRSIHCANDNTCWAVGNASSTLGNLSPILKTTDGGVTWVSQSVPRFTDSLYSVRFSSATTGVIVGGNGTVLRTTNGGTTWILNGYSRKLAYAVNGSYDFAASAAGSGKGDNYTNSLWVNPSAASSSQMTLMGKGDNHWNFQARSSKFEASEANYGAASGNFNTPPFGNINYQNGTAAANFTAGWHHLMGVRVNNTEGGFVTANIESLYVDGGPKSGGTLIGVVNGTSNDGNGKGQWYLDAVSIGRQTDAYARHWTLGPIDEVRSEGVRRSEDWAALTFQTQSPTSSIFSQSAAISTAAPVGLTYSSDPATYKLETPITANTPSFTSGGANIWSVSPALPAGLVLDPVTGVITGTPNTPKATASYTITATNANGTTTKAISITVPAAAVPALTYAGSPYSLTATRSAGLIVPTNASDTVTSCAIAPTLSAGLSINNRCVISGTPTASRTSTSYTVTATNSAGSSTANLSITVADTLATFTSQPAAKSAVLNASGIKFGVAVTNGGSASLTYKWIRKYRPGVNGGATDTIRVVSATAALNDTLSLLPDSLFANSDSTTYKVMVTNNAGSVISNTVLLRIVPSVTYTPSALVLGKVPTTITPVTTSSITSCAISPAIPGGLSIAPTTCIITGTPTTAQAATTYSITPTGPGGAGTATTLTLAIVNAPTFVNYSKDSTATYEQGVAIQGWTPYVSPAPVAPVTFTVTVGALPTGLALDSATGTISGTPTGTGTTTVSIKATNASGFANTDVKITVYATENYTGSSASFAVNTTGSGLGAAQTSFPVLVRLTNAHRAIFQNTTSAGIRFANGTGKHLPYQIESWSTTPTDTSASIWVNVDNVAATGTTTVRMYWGQAGASRSNGELVFPRSQGYQAVWHMNSGATGDESDASSNNLTATAAAAPADTIGAIGHARNFNGTSQYFSVLNSASGVLNFGLNDNYSFSAWTNASAINPGANLGNAIVNKGDNQYAFAIFGSNANTTKYYELALRSSAGFGQASSNPLVVATVGNWRHIVGTKTTPALGSVAESLYVDGVLAGTNAATGMTTTNRVETFNFHIGTLAAGSAPGTTFSRYWQGMLDEIEVSNVARSSDWVKLSYKTQRPGANPVANLAYATTSANYTQGAPITANAATLLGSATRFDVTPALPSGLVIDQVTGAISGAPASPSATTSYTITAFGDSSWTTSATISMKVNAAAPTSVRYTARTLSLLVGTAMTPDTAVVVGAADSFFVAPTLPAGISLNATTGLISGTPTAASSAANYVITAKNTTGSVKDTVNIAVLLANAAPVISAQPRDTTVVGGVAGTFRVTATAPGTLSYQWKKNGTDIAGATSATYSTAAATLADTAAYSVVVTSTLNSATLSTTSSAGNLKVNIAPSISTQPVASQTIVVGGNATMTVAAAAGVGSSAGTLSYQWRKGTTSLTNGGTIGGATTASLTITGLTVADTGSYTVVITRTLNGTTTTTTSNASVLVKPTAIMPDAFVIRVNGEDRPYAFQLPQGTSTERLTLSIVDAWGRTIWSKSVNPAKDKLTEVAWNGRSANGRVASAGMYVVRISVLNQGKTTNYTRRSVTLRPR